jgi:hypothetical protein
MKELTERERAVLHLLKEGLTLQVIATRLNLTRNTVSGLVYRMKGAHVPGAIWPANVRKSKKSPPPRAARRVALAEAASTASGPLTLLELKRTSCRFILGDDLTFYCGEVAETAPYCAAHRKACYTVRQTPA